MKNKADEEKIRDMIELARYEQEEGKKNYIINSYFGFDYVERHMLGGFAAYTICFLLVFVIVVFCKFDDIMGQTNVLKILEMFKPFIGYYVAGLLVYELIVVIVNIIQYSRGKRSIRFNSSELRRFGRKFYSESARQEESRWKS